MEHGRRSDGGERHADDSAPEWRFGIDRGIADAGVPDVLERNAPLRGSAQDHELWRSEIDQQKTGRSGKNPVARIGHLAFAMPNMSDDFA
jgi:hypothetical protein